MAPRGKDLSTEQKQTIVCMSKNGLSSRKISDLIGISPNTVQKVLKRNSDRGSVENKERSGRKRLGSCFGKISEEKSATDFDRFNQCF